MTKIPDSSPADKDYEENVALSYDYTEKSLKEVQDINNNTNAQLGLLIGFNFTFIRFFINDLPGRIIDLDSWFCNSCLLFKILAYSFSITSIILCLFGLYKTVKYFIIPPDILLENSDQVTNQELKLAILDTWIDKLKDFKDITQQKKQILNRAIILLLVSGLMAIMDEIIATTFYSNLFK